MSVHYGLLATLRHFGATPHIRVERVLRSSLEKIAERLCEKWIKRFFLISIGFFSLLYRHFSLLKKRRRVPRIMRALFLITMKSGLLGIAQAGLGSALATPISYVSFATMTNCLLGIAQAGLGSALATPISCSRDGACELRRLSATSRSHGGHGAPLRASRGSRALSCCR